MEELGFKLSKAEAKSFMEVFDLDGLGEIDFTSFVAFARRQPEAHALYGVERKLRTLISKATSQGVDLRESFAHFDVNGDGVITQKEFRKGLLALKFDLTDRELRTLFRRFDPRGDGIRLRDFAKFVDGGSEDGHYLDRHVTAFYLSHVPSDFCYLSPTPSCTSSPCS